MAREATHFLADILREARLAQAFAADFDWESFSVNAMAQHAVERALEIIAKALNNLDHATREKLTSAAIPVRNAIAMRNRLAHNYWSVDPRLLWQTATTRMDELIAAVGALLPVRIELATEDRLEPDSLRESEEPPQHGRR